MIMIMISLPDVIAWPARLKPPACPPWSV